MTSLLQVSILSLFPLWRVLSIAGWSSPVARQAHNLKAAGSNPAPASKKAVFLRLSEVVSDWQTFFVLARGRGVYSKEGAYLGSHSGEETLGCAAILEMYANVAVDMGDRCSREDVYNHDLQSAGQIVLPSLTNKFY